MRRLAKWGWMVALVALAPVRPMAAAEVAVVKSSDVPAWRPAIDALRRVSASHTITEHDLRNDRPTADSVLAGLKGKAAIIVALGPLAAQLVRSTLPDAPLVFAMVQEPAKLGLAPGPGVTGVAFAIPIKNQLAAFRLVNPKGVRIGVIYKEDNSGHSVEEAIKAATLLRVVMSTRAVTSERCAPCSPGTRPSTPSGSRPIPCSWATTRAGSCRPRCSRQARRCTAPPPGWWRRARW